MRILFNFDDETLAPRRLFRLSFSIDYHVFRTPSCENFMSEKHSSFLMILLFEIDSTDLLLISYAPRPWPSCFRWIYVSHSWFWLCSAFLFSFSFNLNRKIICAWLLWCRCRTSNALSERLILAAYGRID